MRGRSTVIDAIVFITVSTFIVLAGCEKTSDAVPPSEKVKESSAQNAQVNRPKIFLDTLPATSVVVRVDGQVITKSELLAWWEVRVKLFAVGRRLSMNNQGDEIKQYRNSSRDRSLAELVRNAMIASYAERNGIKPDPAREKEMERRAMAALHKPKGSFASFAKSLGDDAGLVFTKMIHADALSEAVIATLTTNDIYRITDEEYTNQVAFIKKWNERTDATNIAVKAKASAARREILEGAKFADVAKKCADFCPEQGQMWKQVQLDDFDGGDPLGTWLASHDVGDISEPLDLEDGVSIVGIRMKYPGETEPDGTKTLDTYELVRCAFYAFERFEDHGGDKESIINDMLDARRKDLMLQLREKLEKECKIEFPNGRDLFTPLNKKSKPKKQNLGTKKKHKKTKAKAKIIKAKSAKNNKGIEQ